MSYDVPMSLRDRTVDQLTQFITIGSKVLNNYQDAIGTKFDP